MPADPHRPLVVATLLGLLVLGGCAEDPAEAAATGSATRSPTPAGPTTRTTKPARPRAATTTTRTTRRSTTPRATPPPADGGGERFTVQGTVSARVGGCLLFTPGDMATSWVLVGATAGLAPGQMVDVTGVLGPAPPPGCDQGPAFTVSSAHLR